MIHTKLLTKEPSMDNGIQHYILMYVTIYSLFLLNIKAGVLKDFRVVLLSRSLLNFFKDFCKLNMEQFLRVWKNFAPPPGNSTIIFCPGAGN